MLITNIFLSTESCSISIRDDSIRPNFLFLADFAEVDILEEADKSDSDAQKFNLEWMVKVIYTIKPSE